MAVLCEINENVAQELRSCWKTISPATLTVTRRQTSCSIVSSIVTTTTTNAIQPRMASDDERGGKCECERQRERRQPSRSNERALAGSMRRVSRRRSPCTDVSLRRLASAVSRVARSPDALSSSRSQGASSLVAVFLSAVVLTTAARNDAGSRDRVLARSVRFAIHSAAARTSHRRREGHGSSCVF